MAKDFVEDFKRHRSDNEENNRKARKLTARGWVDTTWESILVGDVIKVTQDEYFCADMLVLASSENKGLCYVETKNLDGETNLKNKQVPKELSSLKNRSEAELFEMQLSVQYEKPNPFLYKFNGSLDIDDSRLPLDQNSFILRGCSLRNSKWCVGVVAYNGHDTKIMLNSVKARPKRSRLELLMNHFIILIFGI
jgi:phospholipid-transporting ATPase